MAKLVKAMIPGYKIPIQILLNVPILNLHCYLQNNMVHFIQRGAGGVMLIVENRHSNTSSNPGWGWLHFNKALILLGKVWIHLFSLQLWVNSRAEGVL